MTMANLLARMTTIGVAPAGEPAAEVFGTKKGAPDRAPGTRVSIFINPQALTFPMAVGLVKGGWEALKHAPLPGMETTWFPFGACLAIGVIITINNLTAQKMTTSMRWLGVFIGILNSLVMFSAVLGVSK
jgi:hypothetical protein